MAYGDTAIARVPGTLPQRVSGAFLSTGAAFVAATLYALNIGAALSLAAYVVALALAYILIRSIMLDLERSDDRQACQTTQHIAAKRAAPAPIEPARHGVDNEDRVVFAFTPSPDAIGKSKPRAKATKKKDTAPAVCPDTNAFDFDGMAALRLQAKITGRWLALDASDVAVECVRRACLALAYAEDINHRRTMNHWFDALMALRRIDKSAFPKAELVRAQVADDVKLGYETVRKIATGRYKPLNDALALIDTRSL